jgi:hypothetical protein
MTGQHVDLVRAGQRDQDVGTRDASRLQNSRARRVAAHRSDIEPILQVPQDVLVRVDDGDLVRLFP